MKTIITIALLVVSLSAFADQAYNDCIAERHKAWDEMDAIMAGWVEIGYTQEMYDRRLYLVNEIGELTNQSISGQIDHKYHNDRGGVARAKYELKDIERKASFNIRRVNRLEVECCKP